MRRSTRVVLLLLALTLGLCCLGVHRASPAALPAPTPPAVPAVLVDELLARGRTDAVTAATENPQRTELPPIAGPAPVASPPALVRVHGQVFRSGQPVRGCDLSFHTADTDGRNREVEWDFTDRNGHFEVELPAARYVVRSEDAAPWTIAILVPSDRQDLLLALHLPP